MLRLQVCRRKEQTFDLFIIWASPLQLLPYTVTLPKIDAELNIRRQDDYETQHAPQKIRKQVGKKYEQAK